MRRGHSRPPRRSGKLLDSNDLRGTGSPRPRHAACVTVGGDLTGRRRDGPHAIESTRFHRPGCCVCGRRGRRRLCGHPTERDTRSSNRCCSARGTSASRETRSGDRRGHRRRPQRPDFVRAAGNRRRGPERGSRAECGPGPAKARRRSDCRGALSVRLSVWSAPCCRGPTSC